MSLLPRGKRIGDEVFQEYADMMQISMNTWADGQNSSG